MKTKFFQKVRLSDKGKEQIQTLANLSAEKREALVDWFSTIHTYPNNLPREAEKIANKIKSTSSELLDSISITFFIFGKIGEYKDDVGDFILDIENIVSLNDEEKQNISEYLGRISKYSDGIFSAYRKNNLQCLGAPILQNYEFSISIKPIFSKAFVYGEDVITNYNPKVVGFVPMIEMELYSSGSAGSFSCECEEAELNEIIAALLSIQAQLVSIRASGSITQLSD
jgi:hypothetical protein